MKETSLPQINVSKIVVGGGIAGAIFTIGGMLIFLTGLPILWFMFPAAAVAGCVVALIRRLVHHKTPGAPWLLSLTVPPEVPRRHLDGLGRRNFPGAPHSQLAHPS